METCPFCGDEMRRGWVRVRGARTTLLQVTFETDDGSGEGSELLPPSWFGGAKRAASCCVGCEAVVVDPKEAAQ